MKDNDCIFCKIVDGEIPSTVVYENDHVLAFEDLNPMMPTHVLIIPKNDDACQTVHHTHVHVLGGAKMNEGNPSLDA